MGEINQFRSSTMKRTILLAASAALLVIPTTMTAQSGAFVSRLGNDTLSVERYTRSADKIEGTILTKSPTTRMVKYTLALAKDGSVTGMEQSILKGDGTPFPGQPTGIKMTFVGDTVVREMTTNGALNVRRTVVPKGTLPALAGSSVYAQLVIAQAKRAKADTVLSIGMAPAQNAPGKVTVRLVGADSAEIANNGFPVGYKLDKAGRVLHADGAKTTQKVIVTLQNDVDIAAIAAVWNASDAAGRSMGAASTRDTLRAEVSGAKITIDYGRPAKRGREIWGKLVPFDTVWRFGANAAARFTTDRDLMVGGVHVPAGTYTIWLLPSAGQSFLILNKQLLASSAPNAPPLWGTGYDAAQDLVRIPVEKHAGLGTVEERYHVFLAGDMLMMHWDTGGYGVKIKAM
jgi:hypothetical protein